MLGELHSRLSEVDFPFLVLHDPEGEVISHWSCRLMTVFAPPQGRPLRYILCCVCEPGLCGGGRFCLAFGVLVKRFVCLLAVVLNARSHPRTIVFCMALLKNFPAVLFFLLGNSTGIW